MQRINRVSAWRALFEGRDAAVAGKTGADNPYNPNGGVGDRVKFRFWNRGLSQARMALAKKDATQAP
jgi:hypothetical protein